MSLMPRHIIGDLDLTDYPFAVIRGSSDYGMPTNVAEIIDSMLQDGEIVSSTRTSNRVMSHSVFIEEADMQALAEAEARLIAECDKQRNTWSIDPGDGYGAVTVFDIFRVQVAYVHDDNWEWAGYRRYDLTIPALPFGRSDSEVVDEALTSGAVPSTVTIADGSSATGWTGDAAVTSSGGTLRQSASTSSSAISTGTYYDAAANFTYSPAAPIDFSATPYLSVDFKFISGGTVNGTSVTAYADGVQLVPVAHYYSSAAPGFYRSIFLCPDPSVSSLRLRVSTTNYFPNGAPVSIGLPFEIDNVTRSNQAPSASTTGRESLRSVAVTGSARTQASLTVQHETESLGDVLVYTCPALSDAVLGYRPDLRRWRTAGSDSSTYLPAVTGVVEPLTSTTTFAMPATSMPKGTYVLVGRLSSTDVAKTVRIRWNVSTGIGATSRGTQTVTSSEIALATSVSTIAPLGVATLPPTDVSASSVATVRFTGFTTPTGSLVGVEWDQLWAFYIGEGAALTQVACGEGAPSLGAAHNRLWLDTASLDRFEPSVWMGTLADRSDAFHAGDNAPSWGVHAFAPPSMNMFVVTTGAANPKVELRHFPRFHTHAVKKAS